MAVGAGLDHEPVRVLCGLGLARWIHHPVHFSQQFVFAALLFKANKPIENEERPCVTLSWVEPQHFGYPLAHVSLTNQVNRIAHGNNSTRFNRREQPS